MRTAFFQTLVELAEKNPDIVLVTGDLGFGVVDEFAERFPKQFVNVGVAEQNMTGVAAGMALAGKTVVTYSIGNFPTLRCLEQIRSDICYHRADVKVVSVGGGFAYGALGMSHHATEDLAIMRSLPEMIVAVPADPTEARALARAVIQKPGPCYLRLGRAGEPDVHSDPSVSLELGKAIVLKEGTDVMLIATGSVLRLAVEVAEALEAEGTSAGVMSMHTLKPLDVDAIASAAGAVRGLFTIEEHSVLGGLGGAVAEALAELPGPHPTFKRFGVPDSFAPAVGDQERIWSMFGLSVESIVDSINDQI